MTRLIPGFTVPLDYPSSDGKPVAETDAHIDALFDLRNRLKVWAAAQENVYAAGNMLVYYSEGNVGRHLAPDCFVAFGVPNHDRETFKTWVEGTAPSVVFEITSKSTRREDTVTKRETYQNEWEVDEYFLFDPFEDYLSPPLQGFRRVRGQFQPMKLVKGKLTSRALGLTLERDGERLVLRDVKSGEPILTADEQARLNAERRAERSDRKAAKVEAEKDQMVAEVARLKAELAALKKK